MQKPIWLTTHDGIRFDLSKSLEYFAHNGSIYIVFPVAGGTNHELTTITYARNMDPDQEYRCISYIDNEIAASAYGTYDPAVKIFPPQFRGNAYKGSENAQDH